MNKKLTIWELSLVIGLFISLGVGLWAQTTQSALSEKLVRLHVVANSDSDADQELKLTVRDKVLESAEPLISDAGSSAEAALVLSENLAYLEEQARTVSGGYEVHATLEYEDFPTREYDGFSLPAGTYQALRLTIGEAEGRNWWCVVFPPLCDSGDIGASAKLAGLTDGEVALIADGDGVQIKFKCIEIWEKIRRALK